VRPGGRIGFPERPARDLDHFDIEGLKALLDGRGRRQFCGQNGHLARCRAMTPDGDEHKGERAKMQADPNSVRERQHAANLVLLRCAAAIHRSANLTRSAPAIVKFSSFIE
jgi:hypothetical protein